MQKPETIIVQVNQKDDTIGVQSPIRFWFRKSKKEIMEIEDRWYGNDGIYFKVFADDALHYILHTDIAGQSWCIVSIVKSDTLE